MNHHTKRSNFQILSLDGGGIKGLFSAAVLAKLEEDLRTDIIKHFDLITGTSTGGIIALALGLGVPPGQIVEFYAEQGPKIFSGPKWWRSLRHPFRNKYPQKPLEVALREVFGERTLAESAKRLVIPAFSLDNDNVYLFKTPHHEHLRRDWRVPAWQVALATSAAPTYLPASHFTDRTRLIDGGVWANNPTVVGIAEALSMLNVNLADIRVLNLGTSSPVKHRHKRLDHGGLIAWSRAAVDVTLRAQSCSTHATAIHLLGKENVVRLDPLVPEGIFGLDSVKVDELYALAAQKSRDFAPKFKSAFANHVASPFTPLYPPQEAAA